MKEVPISAILSIVAGVAILLLPQLLSYLIALYLIVIGILTIMKRP